MKTIIRVPATTANLGPGFDSLGLALAIWNELEVEERTGESGITLSLEGFGSGSLPEDGRNLIVRAAYYLFTSVDEPVPALHFHCRNNFPSSSGLGSSSSAILMGLLGANACLSNPLGQQQLLDLANEFEGHPDNVTPGLLGGLTLSVVDSGAVLARKVIPEASWWVGAVVPALSISTASMRAALPAHAPLADAVFNLSRTPLVVKAFIDGDLPLLRTVIEDRLHQPYRLPLIRGARAALVQAAGLGAAATLSGAGPGVVAFTCDELLASAAIAAMRAVFMEKGLQSWAWTGKIDLDGAKLDVG